MLSDWSIADGVIFLTCTDVSISVLTDEIVEFTNKAMQISMLSIYCIFNKSCD